MLIKSRQLILVLTQDWNSVEGWLYRYQRPADKRKWLPIGEPIPAVIGKNGLAWGIDLRHGGEPGRMKREGDVRSPAGIYAIGSSFGFKSTPDPSMKMPYIALTNTSVCVDDPRSRYYNRLVDSAEIPEPDWQSGEQMRKIPLYRLGSMIQYNTEQQKGKGSCIFMHIWSAPSVGTGGCIAMEEDSLKEILDWLSPNEQPVIALFPRKTYRDLRELSELPSVTED